MKVWCQNLEKYVWNMEPIPPLHQKNLQLPKNGESFLLELFVNGENYCEF